VFLSAFNRTCVVDAVKQEEATAEKRYFDGLIHDGIQYNSNITVHLSVCCNALCFAVGSFTFVHGYI